MNYKKIVGNYGEQLAVEYLLRKNYKILERNVQISHQEIDVVTSFKGKTVFFEVKTSTTFSEYSAEEAINSHKINNLQKAMSSYCYQYKIDPDYTQLDVIIVNIDKINKTANIKHYLNII